MEAKDFENLILMQTFCINKKLKYKWGTALSFNGKKGKINNLELANIGIFDF